MLNSVIRSYLVNAFAAGSSTFPNPSSSASGGDEEMPLATATDSEYYYYHRKSSGTNQFVPLQPRLPLPLGSHLPSED